MAHLEILTTFRRLTVIPFDILSIFAIILGNDHAMFGLTTTVGVFRTRNIHVFMSFFAMLLFLRRFVDCRSLIRVFFDCVSVYYEHVLPCKALRVLAQRPKPEETSVQSARKWKKHLQYEYIVNITWTKSRFAQSGRANNIGS